MSDGCPSPLISVVIPTRRRVDSLSRCLDRLRPGGQSLAADRYEVIVTDDGDGDETRRLIADRYPWCRYTTGPRRGPAANRNHGARQARGLWLAFVDDDCLPDRGWLLAFEGAARTAENTTVFEGKTTCADGISSPLYQAPVNLKGGWLWSCNMMVLTAAFSRLGGFDERFRTAHLEDVDLRERIAIAGDRFAFVPTAIVDHPPRRNSIGTSAANILRAELFYRLKYGKNVPNRVQYAIGTVRLRARQTLSFPLSADLFLFGLIACREVATVLRTYGQCYRGAQSDLAKRTENI